MEQQSEFVRHEPCPRCPSSDAFAVFSDGHGFCFSCNYYKPADGDGSVIQTPRTYNPVNYDGEFAAIRSRNITEETCRKFNVRISPTGDSIRFPYYTSSGRICGWKERSQDKEFRWVGKNEDNQLFGQNLFGGGKTLVCVEGEFDALAVWQARPNWPVCSVPSGAKGARKALSKQLQWLLKFEEVILMFDTDQPGIEAAEECVSLFPHD